jgi:LacI family transcriptional regulator
VATAVPNNVAEQGRVTLRMVAARAEVSLATASYALRPGPRSVTPALRQRVVAAAQELGYELQPRGRTRRRSLTVAAIVPEATNPFFAEVIHGAENALRTSGHRLLVASSWDEPAVEAALVASIRGRVDGLLLTPSGPVSPEARSLAADGMPVVLVDRDGGAQELTSVVLDNRESAKRATRLLVASGFSRIALLNGPERITTAQERTLGYLEALAEAGLAADPADRLAVDFTVDDGHRAADALLRRSDRPAAVFSASVILTTGLLLSLRDHGLSVGRDLALVSYGDTPWASLVDPAITVIEQPTTRLGEAAVGLLLADPPATAPHHMVLKSRLVLRDSHWRPGGQPHPPTSTFAAGGAGVSP